jgi:hypothetical protein
MLQRSTNFLQAFDYKKFAFAAKLIICREFQQFLKRSLEGFLWQHSYYILSQGKETIEVLTDTQICAESLSGIVHRIFFIAKQKSYVKNCLLKSIKVIL